MLGLSLGRVSKRVKRKKMNEFEPGAFGHRPRSAVVPPALNAADPDLIEEFTTRSGQIEAVPKSTRSSLRTPSRGVCIARAPCPGPSSENAGAGGPALSHQRLGLRLTPGAPPAGVPGEQLLCEGNLTGRELREGGE